MSKNLSFEEALKELEEIVNSLERGDVSLEEAIEAYERGSMLKNQCEKRLKEAKMKVEKIQSSQNGKELSVKTESSND